MLDSFDPPPLVRSASVREPSKPHSQTLSPGGTPGHPGKREEESSKNARDTKRRTVQVEYVAPRSETSRGETSPPPVPSATKASSNLTPETVRKGTIQPLSSDSRHANYSSTSSRKALPQSPVEERQENRRHNQSQSSAAKREALRAESDSGEAVGHMPPTSVVRPATGGSMSSTGPGRLPSRGNSYGQPLAPTVAVTNAQGSLAQPKSGRSYNISAPVPQQEPEIPTDVAGRPVSQRLPGTRSSITTQSDMKGHKRANTFGNVFSRSGSLFGGRPPAQATADIGRTEKKYPPTSMKAPISSDESQPRTSTDQRRPSFGFSRKGSDISKPEKEQKTRRFSLLPASFSLKSMAPSLKVESRAPQDARPGTQPANFSYSSPTAAAASSEGRRQDNKAREQHARHVSAPIQANERKPPRSAPYPDTLYSSNQYSTSWRPGDPGTAYPYGEVAPTESNKSFAQQDFVHSPHVEQRPARQPTQKARYPQGFNEFDQEPYSRPSTQGQRQGGRVLHKPNRKFADAWDMENEANHQSSTSGAARRVMDFFRRRGKARAGDDR